MILHEYFDAADVVTVRVCKEYGFDVVRIYADFAQCQCALLTIPAKIDKDMVTVYRHQSRIAVTAAVKGSK